MYGICTISALKGRFLLVTRSQILHIIQEDPGIRVMQKYTSPMDPYGMIFSPESHVAVGDQAQFGRNLACQIGRCFCTAVVFLLHPKNQLMLN